MNGPMPLATRNSPERPGVLRLACWIWVPFALSLGLAALSLVWIVNRYDNLSYKWHAQYVRSAVRWRWGRLVALLPLLAQAPLIDSGASLPYQVIWLVVGLAAAEVYSVCLHRESYIAAYEPWWIPQSAAPLGARPSRPSDRRLHYIVRVQTVYLVPLAASSLLVCGSSPLVAWLLCFAFIAKFVAPAWIDYEAYFHWDMHCSILSMPAVPKLTMIWRAICEWILGPAVGSLPYLYSTEHIAIHHPANAGPDDIHSPLRYARDSIVEFTHYAVKTSLILATAWGVIQHRRCTASRRLRLMAGLVVVFGICLATIATHHPLGYWLAAAVAYRGTNTAIAQYVWHGLHDGTGSSSPLSTTVLWLPGTVPSALEMPTIELTAAVDFDPVHPVDGLVEYVPEPGSDWAFFDNYHLIHHLHPRAHFSEYPTLLDRDLGRVLTAGSPVLTLDAYPTFFSDLMARRLDRIATSFVASVPVSEREALVRDRLAPLPGTRSTIATATESRVGQKIDSCMSLVWAAVRAG